jgi:hypothetical protein
MEIKKGYQTQLNMRSKTVRISRKKDIKKNDFKDLIVSPNIYET